MIMPEQISPLGIGTFRINESSRADALRGLRYSLERGQNFLSTGFSYADGAVVDYLKDLFRAVDRESLFLCVYAEPDLRSAADVATQLEAYLTAFHTDYVDCFQVHNPFLTTVPLEEIYPAMETLRAAGKVRYLGVSNVSPTVYDQLRSTHPLTFFEGLYNLECRTYEDCGILDTCRRNGTRFVCYQPLRRNRTAQRNYPLLVELAAKYGRSQNQILLNWILCHRGLQAIVKSLTPGNIDANLAALEFRMEPVDYARLDAFRSEECQRIPISWGGGEGVSIDQLANQY